MKVRMGNGCMVMLEPETMEESAALWRACEDYAKNKVIVPAPQPDGRVFAAIDLRQEDKRG